MNKTYKRGHWKFDVRSGCTPGLRFGLGMTRTLRNCFWLYADFYHWHGAICVQRFSWIPPKKTIDNDMQRATMLDR